jgi:hypothetical protein
MDENLAFGLFLLLLLASTGLLWMCAKYLRLRKGPTSWGWVCLINLLVLSVLLSFVLVAGETYYRFFQDTTDSLAYTKSTARWYQRHWQDNSTGCRDNVTYAVRKLPGKRRITFVGDSFTAGHGIKNVEDRFPNRIRAAHPEWDIHVLAQPGSDTGGEVQYLTEMLGQGYQIEQVVLVYCLNDISDLIPAWDKSREKIVTASKPTGWLPRSSFFINTICHRIAVHRNPSMKNYFGFVRDSYQGEIWRQQQARLRSFLDVVQSHGGRLAVVTFPFVHAVGPNYEFREVHARLDQFWREMNVPHLDLLSIYQDLPPKEITVNRFDAHPNEFANALAADAIARFLSQTQ